LTDRQCNLCKGWYSEKVCIWFHTCSSYDYIYAILRIKKAVSGGPDRTPFPIPWRFGKRHNSIRIAIPEHVLP